MMPEFKKILHDLELVTYLSLNSQDYFELPKKTVRANGNVHHQFKLNIFRDILHIYPDKASMVMTRTEPKLFTSTGWNEIYQPLAFDMTKDKYTGRYR